MLLSSPAALAATLLQLAVGVTALPTHKPHNIHIHHARPQKRECKPNSNVGVLAAEAPVNGKLIGPSILTPASGIIRKPSSAGMILGAPNLAPKPNAQPLGQPNASATQSLLPTINDPAYQKLTSILPGVLKNAVEISEKSWEVGTITEALFELDNENLTPFAWNGNALDSTTAVPKQALGIIAHYLNEYNWDGSPQANTDENLANYLSWDTSKASLDASRDLARGDGSLGDRCSLGTATWVLAHFAESVADVGTTVQSADAYAWAVGNQYQNLLQGPQQEGVYSHRAANWELWSDQGYMIPPFLAYLGLATKNRDLLSQALTQWKGTSDKLINFDTGLYRHVSTFDPNYWLTGNAWMLMGLTRVLASIKASGFTLDTNQLEVSAAATFKSLFERANDAGLMPNYLDTDDADLTHPESAGTAGVVAAYYRFLKLRPDLAAPFKAQAEKSFSAVVSKIGADNWLKEVVDPSGNGGFFVKEWENTRSAEGQSFVVLMYAARRAAGQ